MRASHGRARVLAPVGRALLRPSHTITTHLAARAVHTLPAALRNVVSFPLADIGEGIAEVEVLEWYVLRAARITRDNTSNIIYLYQHLFFLAGL